MIPDSNSALIMESKDETSDTDSGIILHSGPDSPMTPLKDLTHAMKLRQKALEEKLEACLEELKKICIREAELTGKLPKEYPLAPGENPPRTRRRIGAAFKLDERTIQIKGEDSVISSLERDFALQCQITEAARRLAHEPHLSKHIKKQRKNAVVKEEKKLRDLEHTLNDHRVKAGHKPLTRISRILAEELSASDDSSLSDAAILDDEETQSQKSHASSEVLVPAGPNNVHYSPQLPTRTAQPVPPQTLEGLNLHSYSPSKYDRSPIQNTEWKESSLDKPYEKPKKCSSTPSSKSSSPSVTPQLTPVATPIDLRMSEMPSFHFVPINGMTFHNHSSSSAPSTPELQSRRLPSRSMRMAKADFTTDTQEQRGRSMVPRRRPTDFTAINPEYRIPPPRVNISNPIYCSSSEDSNSDISALSYDTSSQDGSPDKTMPWGGYQPPPNGYNSPLLRSAPINHQEAQGFYKNAQHMSSPSFYKMYGFPEGRSASPLTRELEFHHQLEGRAASPLSRELEFRHPFEGRAASPLTRELEFRHPLENRTASPLIRELEFRHPLENRTASPLSRELEFRHPLENRTASPLTRELEYHHSLENRTASPLTRELEYHHSLENRTASPLTRELEYHHSLENRTASALTRELEFRHPLENRTASPLTRELEYHYSLENRTASPLTRELEFLHPLEGRTASPLPREFEFCHPPLKSIQSAQFPHREYHYGDERTHLQMQRVKPSHSRIVRTPSLKEYPHRGLPRELVSEELQSWHKRSIRSKRGRPHSLDRQGAIRVHSIPDHGHQSLRVPPQHFQAPQKHSPQRHVLKRNPDGVPSQWYLPEEAEIVSQV
ncbi:innate immunity activator protein [Protopterus annectens]|uniref:innate immunity activator protein n=1 Tax=Protopterus annectens TaxID=7888 RepID=UPI001CFA1808|nr:innate immunity activator protein [Protopterus annectens]XP_043932601.1 innate immunity activator protein [Protopterus annectens]XP_043932603.1 innate immunity activator protein [Protopterus annectens]